MPSTTVTVSEHERDDAGRPGEEPERRAADDGEGHRAGSRLGPAADQDDAAVVAGEAAGQMPRREPRGGCVAEHERGGARDVGVDAGRGGDAHRAERPVDRQPGRRIEQVVAHLVALAPAPHGHARRRDARRTRSTIVWPGASSPAVWSSVTRTGQPPAGAGPAIAMSPPRLTSTPQPERRGDVASRHGRPRTPSRWRRDRAGRRPEPGSSHRTGSTTTHCQPGTRCARSVRGRSLRRRSRRSRGRSPAGGAPCPIVGSTRPSVIRAARSAISTASTSSGSTRTAWPLLSLTRLRSESARNRLHACSTSSSSSAISRERVVERPAPSTTMRAVVPSARVSSASTVTRHEPPELAAGCLSDGAGA